jgi:hypothetical protein
MSRADKTKRIEKDCNTFTWLDEACVVHGTVSRMRRKLMIK